MKRPSIEIRAMSAALVASLGSEDPKRKVGAAGVTSDNRIVVSAYNGLMSGVRQSPSWWHEDYNRRTFVIHAEANLCSLTSRNEVPLVAVTTLPCGPCARQLAAHGVKTILYGGKYGIDPSGEDICSFYGVELVHVPLKDCKKAIEHMLHFQSPQEFELFPS